ncbi:MAG: hypothetical protein WCV41_00855 [Patescibacteria group bacterium]
MENKNQNFGIWPEGEKVNLSEREKEDALLAGINQTAMQEALKEIAAEKEIEFRGDQTPLFQLAEELREETGAQAADEKIIFQTEIMETAGSFLNNEAAPEPAEEMVAISKQKLNFIKKLINNIKENSRRLEELLGGDLSAEENAAGIEQFAAPQDEEEISAQTGEKIIEGVFNGQQMIGPDGKQYSIPPNYASKSKLVEGDILKLTIGQNGKFIYKQIGPIERERVIGKLTVNKSGEYLVEQGSKRWKILTASVTYFKGEPDDEAVILVPKYGESNWAAVENIITQNI